MLLDARIALLTERALQSEEGAEAMSKMYAWLMISRLLVHYLLNCYSYQVLTGLHGL